MIQFGKIEKAAVIGAGQIGPDIALHLAKTLAGSNFKLSIVDISAESLEKAKARVQKKLAKLKDVGAMSDAQMQSILGSMEFTTNYESVKGASLVIEAATENGDVKDKIFRQVEQLTGPECIFLSNSSHMQPEVIFRNIQDKGRTLVAHYFYPADVNMVVELVPGEATNPEVVKHLMKFYERIGKMPVEVKSSYGYAIDPVFEGLGQVAITCLERGWGNEKQIDAAAVKALRLGVGPFTALNLTGGNPITAHGLDEMGKLVMPWFRTPETLHRMNKEKKPWNTAQRGEQVETDPELEEKLVKEFKAAYFALTCYILDRGIIEVNDYNISCEMSLVVRPPFTFMNQTGMDTVRTLVKDFCARNPEFPYPTVLDQAVADGGWKLRDIVSSKVNDVLVITIRRPKVLNALNLDVLIQIENELKNAAKDTTLKGVAITGFGTKAFVSGADIQMLASLKTPEEGFDNSQTFQRILNYIDGYHVPVVCAMNGFAFGGGNELAMACDVRICKKGLKALICQPEVNLGFIPGAGGTQRLPRIIGMKAAAEILRTGRSVSGSEALSLGFVAKEVDGDLVEEAVRVVEAILAGQLKPNAVPHEPIVSAVPAPDSLEIGHLSKKIDEILVRAIYEGAQKSLADGLKLESEMFAQCMLTKDMKIGLENFKTNGPKVKAEFIHS